MTNYRYVFSSLRNEQVIEEIPLYGVFMDMELNVGGQFNGTFNLDQTGKMNSALLDATLPGKTFVTVERNDIVVWAGIVWSRVYQSQSKSMQLFAQSFESYPQYQIIENDLAYVDDTRNIFIQLWSNMQSTAARNLNIEVPPLFSPPASSNFVEVRAIDYKFYSEIMDSLADAADGFDWYIGVSKDSQYYRKKLVVGNPNLGVGPSDYMTVFEYPGSIINYYCTESMAESATDLFLFGSGEGSSIFSNRVENTTMLNQGWPRYDKDVSFKDISVNSNTFIELSAQEAVNRTPPMQVLKVTVKSNKDPVFGSWNLGDTVKVVIKDARFPDGFQQNTRIVKWELRPQSSDNSEEASLIFQGDQDA